MTLGAQGDYVRTEEIGTIAQRGGMVLAECGFDCPWSETCTTAQTATDRLRAHAASEHPIRIAVYRDVWQ